jgi:hypothetical protein
MIRRIDMSLEEEFRELNKEKEQKMEKYRLKIIAENEEELKLLQENLD